MMNESFATLRRMIDAPPEPLEAAAEKVRRLIAEATVAVPISATLGDEIKAFESDYELFVGMLLLTRPGGPMPSPDFDAEPLRTVLNERLMRIEELCERSGTVH